MNNDATHVRILQQLKAVSVINAPQPAASGYRYKADNPVLELVVTSTTAATVTALIEGSLDGVTWSPVVTLTVATTAQKLTNNQVSRATGSMFALWRATVQSVSGDQAATAYVNLLG